MSATPEVTISQLALASKMASARNKLDVFEIEIDCRSV